MAVTTQKIRVDLNTGKVIPVAYTHQNDSARTFIFDMYNDGLPYTMTGNTVKFAYKSPIVNGQYTVIAGSSMASGTVSGNTVSVTLPAAYTAISGVGLLTMIITPTSGTIRPVNIKFIVQKSADGDDSIAGASDFPATLDEIAENWLDENISIQIDDTLSVSGKAADAKVTGDEISELDGQIDDLKSDLNTLLNDVNNAVFDIDYTTDITATGSEQGAQIYYKASTDEYIKATTSGVAYWKVTTFPAQEYAYYKAYGAYAKDAPIAIFIDSDGNYIGSTDTHPNDSYTAVRDTVTFRTPAKTAAIAINIFSYSYTATLTKGTLVNNLDDDVQDLYTITDAQGDAFDEFTATGQMSVNVGWEQGNLDTNGQPISANNFVRSAGYIDKPGTYLIKANGQTAYGYKYLSDGTRDGSYFWSLTGDINITIDATHKARLVAKNGQSSFAPSECNVTVYKQTVVRDIVNMIPKAHGDFISICHQGYSESDTLGHCLLSGYSLAKDKGFDWGETDLKKTSDGILVCCHDSTFVDQTTQETVTISQHTLAELQEYNYYGGTIATFEQILAECKKSGLGLVIDQIVFDYSNDVFPLVKKYAMQDRVAYLLIYHEEYPSLITSVYNNIHTADADAHIMVIPSSANVLDDAISFCNSIKTATNIVELSLNYGVYSVQDVIACQDDLDSRVNVVVWTIDGIDTCRSYLPYVAAITSNKISSADLF